MPRQPVERRIQVDPLSPAPVGRDGTPELPRVPKTQNPPPPAPSRRPALVGHYRQEPRPQLGAGPKATKRAPSLQRRLLHRVLRRASVFQHRHREPERRVEDGRQQLIEGMAVARLRPLEAHRQVRVQASYRFYARTRRSVTSRNKTAQLWGRSGTWTSWTEPPTTTRTPPTGPKTSSSKEAGWACGRSRRRATRTTRPSTTSSMRTRMAARAPT